MTVDQMHRKYVQASKANKLTRQPRVVGGQGRTQNTAGFEGAVQIALLEYCFHNACTKQRAMTYIIGKFFKLPVPSPSKEK